MDNRSKQPGTAPMSAMAHTPMGNRTMGGGFPVYELMDGNSTMLTPKKLDYDLDVPEPKTAFLFGLALGAIVPLFVLAVSA
jgi:hypothetical protein